MLVPETPAPGTGCAQPSAGCCTATPACKRDVVKRFRLSLCTKEKLFQFCSHLLLYSCRAGAALLLLLLLPCSEHRWPLSRTGCRTASSAVHFATPWGVATSWIDVQEVLPHAGSTTYKDMLAVLALHLVLVRLSSSSMTLT